MSVSVSLPALGESVTEGTVTRRLKAVGDEVAENEPLLEVSTDKVDTEIPSPVAGVLLETAVAEDETAEVGAELAVIGAAGTAPATAPAAPAAPDPAPAPAPVTPAPVAPTAVSPADDGAYVTPLVRKLASEKGVDLSTVKGIGVGGRIRKQDVIAAAEAAKTAAPAAAAASKAPVLEASPLRGQTVKLPHIRKAIAANIHKALLEQAQLSSVIEVDITKLMKLRAKAKDGFAAREGVKLSPMPFFVKAAVQALKAHPVTNARLNHDEGTITYFDSENVGIAVDSEKGVPTTGHLPPWPAYLPGRSVMFLDATAPAVHQDPARPERLLWNGLR